MNYTTDDLAHICNDLASSGADPALEFVAQRLWELDAEVKRLREIAALTDAIVKVHSIIMDEIQNLRKDAP